MKRDFEASPSDSDNEMDPTKRQKVAQFPPADKLIPLPRPDWAADKKDPTASPALRYNKVTYNKTDLSPRSRAVDGWRMANTEKTKRADVISKILSRWWYVFPMWPNPETDYSKVLEKRGCRIVQIKDWNTEPEEENGLKKVYELGQFPGVFRDSNHEMLDMRSKHDCPCFANLAWQPMSNLLTYLIRALDNQIAILTEVKGYRWEQYKEELEQELRLWQGDKQRLIREYDEGGNANKILEEISRLRKL